MLPASTRAVRDARRAETELFASEIANSRTANATPINKASRPLAATVRLVSPSRRPVFSCRAPMFRLPVNGLRHLECAMYPHGSRRGVHMAGAGARPRGMRAGAAPFRFFRGPREGPRSRWRRRASRASAVAALEPVAGHGMGRRTRGQEPAGAEAEHRTPISGTTTGSDPTGCRCPGAGRTRPVRARTAVMPQATVRTSRSAPIVPLGRCHPAATGWAPTPVAHGEQTPTTAPPGRYGTIRASPNSTLIAMAGHRRDPAGRAPGA